MEVHAIRVARLSYGRAHAIREFRCCTLGRGCSIVRSQQSFDTRLGASRSFRSEPREENSLIQPREAGSGGIDDQLVAQFVHLHLGQREGEPFSKLLRGQLAEREAGEVGVLCSSVVSLRQRRKKKGECRTRTLLHQFDQGDDPLGVLPRVPERALEELLELEETGTVVPAEDVNVVLRQLEGRHFETDRAGRVGE